MPVFDWSNSVTRWHFNPKDVRDPTIVFNNVANRYGSAPGYDGTEYDFEPKNFLPNTSVPASTWTQIPLDQFGVGPAAKQVILTGNCGIAGVNKWNGTIYAWFRAPGSDWNLSPVFDGGYAGSLCVHAPVGLTAAGVPAIEMAWGAIGLDSTNWGIGVCVDTPWLNLILSGWGE